MLLVARPGVIKSPLTELLWLIFLKATWFRTEAVRMNMCAYTDDFRETETRRGEVPWSGECLLTDSLFNRTLTTTFYLTFLLIPVILGGYVIICWLCIFMFFSWMQFPFPWDSLLHASTQKHCRILAAT